MKAHFITIGLFVLIVAAVAFTGCTTQSATTQAGNFGQGTQAAAAQTASPASSSPQAGSTTSATSIFGTNYKWMEYKTTTTSQGTTTTTDTKTERSTEDYQGTPAVHLKMTTTMSNGMNSIYDVYYDTAMKSVLGGTMTMTVNGQTVTRDVPATQLQNQMGSNFNHDFSVTYAGIEPVTVPAGTYPVANKYTATVNNVDATYWSVSGIPVPVKYSTSSSQGSTTSSAELVGWG